MTDFNLATWMCSSNNILWYLSLPPDYTDLAMSTVMQRLSIAYTGTIPLLHFYLSQLARDIEELPEKRTLKVFGCVTVQVEPRMVIVEVSD